MNTLAMAKATAWLSERLPDARLSDLAAMLAIGVARRPTPLPRLAEELGMPPAWLEGFVERHTIQHGGLAPLVEVHGHGPEATAQLSQVGHNILNQFWQRAATDPSVPGW